MRHCQFQVEANGPGHVLTHQLTVAYRGQLLRVSESLHVPCWLHTLGPGNPVTRVRWGALFASVPCECSVTGSQGNHGGTTDCVHILIRMRVLSSRSHTTQPQDTKSKLGSDATPCDGARGLSWARRRTVLTLGHSAKTGPSSRDNTKGPPHEAKTRQVHNSEVHRHRSINVGASRMALCGGWLSRIFKEHRSHLLTRDWHVQGYPRVFSCSSCKEMASIGVGGIACKTARSSGARNRRRSWKKRSAVTADVCHHGAVGAIN